MNILVVSNSFSPTVEINFIEPLRDLYRSGLISAWVFKDTKNVTMEDIAWSSIVILVRDFSSESLKVILSCRALSKKILYLLDDNLGYLPIELSLGRVTYSEKANKKIPLVVGLVDETLLQNKLIQNELENFGRVRIFPQWVRNTTPLHENSSITHNKGREARILYATARRLESITELELIRDLEILNKEINFVFSTFASVENSVGFRTRRLKRTKNLFDYFSTLKSGEFIIGVAPLDRNHFYNSKTEAKFRDYAQTAIPGIYSNIPPYSDVIEDGVDGLLVPGIYSTWREAISALLDDEELRCKIVLNALTKVNSKYDYVQYKSELKNTIEAFAKPPHANPSKFRGVDPYLTICTIDGDSFARNIAEELAKQFPNIVTTELRSNAPITPVLLYSCQKANVLENYKKIFTWTESVHEASCSCENPPNPIVDSIYALDTHLEILRTIFLRLPEKSIQLPPTFQHKYVSKLKDIRFYIEMKFNTYWGIGQGKRP